MQPMKRLQKNKDKDATHIVYMPQYFQGDFDKSSTKDYEFYMNIGLYPVDTFNLLSFLTGLKPGHVKDLKEELTYRCPYTGNHYYGAFPVAYLANKPPEHSDPKNELETLIAESVYSFKENEDIYGINHIGEIGRSILGHGYRAETLSTDIMTLGLCDIITQPNQDEKIIFKTWKHTDLGI